MKYLKSFLTVGCIAALAWGISACSEDDEPKVDEKSSLQSITVTPATVSLIEGATKQLVVATVPEGITGVTVTYASAHAAIATVSASGLVTAVAEGATTITVSAPGVTAVKVPVTVGSALTGLTVTPEAVALLLGSATLTQQLTVVPQPEGLAGATITYASSDAAIATVSDAGLVTAVALGAATITITGTAPGPNGNTTVTELVPVTVGSALTGLTVTPEAVALALVEGLPNTQQLAIATVPEGAIGVTYTYTSSDANIATVSDAGLVTAVAAGAATITITGALPGLTPVTAIVPVTVAGIDATLNRSAWTAEATSTLDANAAALMFDGSIPTIWHSSAAGTLPQGFTTDMHGYKRISGFYYYNRIAGVSDRAFPKNITVETSLDNDSWTTVYTNANVSDKTARIVLSLGEPVVARYFKVTVTATHNEANWTYLAEFGAYNDDDSLSAPEAIALISPANNQEHFIADPLTFSWKVDDPEPAGPYTLKISRNFDLSDATIFTVLGTSKAFTTDELKEFLDSDITATVYWSVSADGADSPAAARTLSLVNPGTLLNDVLVNAKQPFIGVQNNPEGADPAQGQQWWDRNNNKQLQGWEHSNALISWTDRFEDGTYICFEAFTDANLPWTTNSKVYQTVMNLDAGDYNLVFHFHSIQGGRADVYGVVATGDTLPDYEAVTAGGTVLGYTPIPDTTPNADYAASFTVEEAGPVTIGWVFNTVNIGHPYVFFRLSGLDLYRY
jgi:uncharacterized protein YjdB